MRPPGTTQDSTESESAPSPSDDSAADPSGRTTTTWTKRDKPARVVHPLGRTVTYSYEARGLRSVMTDPDGGRFSYTHDAAGRLTRVINPQGRRTTLSYDLQDRRLQKTMANTSQSRNTWDNAGRLTRVVHLKNTLVTISRFQYRYDALARRTGVTELDGDRVTWTYDKTSRLVNERRSGTAAYNVTHVYDPAGNRTRQVDAGALTTYSYDAANELLTEVRPASRATYTYDNCGNRTKKDDSSAGITDYAWDEIHRMTAAEPPAGRLTMQYDADKRLVRRENDGEKPTRYVYDGRNVLVETGDAGVTEREFTATGEEYGELISQYDGTDTDDYIFDGLGSTDALLDGSQTSTDTYVYRAYGEVTDRTGTGVNSYEYVGRQGVRAEPALDLVRMDRRFYDPATGRFVSEDPIGIDAGDNFYTYVFNNPVNLTDPSGLDVFASSKEVADSVSKFFFEQVGAQTVIGKLPGCGADQPNPAYYVTLFRENQPPDGALPAGNITRSLRWLARGNRPPEWSPAALNILAVAIRNDFTHIDIDATSYATHVKDLTFLEGRAQPKNALANIEYSLNGAGWTDTAPQTIEHFKKQLGFGGGLFDLVGAFLSFIGEKICDFTENVFGVNICKLVTNLFGCAKELAGNAGDFITTLYQGREKATDALFKGGEAAIAKVDPLDLLLKGAVKFLGIENVDAKSVASRIGSFDTAPGPAFLAVLEMVGISPASIGAAVTGKLKLPGYLTAAVGVLTDELLEDLKAGDRTLPKTTAWVSEVASGVTEGLSLAGLVGLVKSEIESKALTELRTVGEQVVTGGIKKLVPGVGTVSAALGALNAAATMCDSISALIAKIVVALQTAVNEPAKGAAAVESAIATGLEAVTEKLLRALTSFLMIDDVPARLKGAGERLLDGVAGAVETAARPLVERVKSFAGSTGALAPVRQDTFLSNTPFKVFLGKDKKYYISYNPTPTVEEHAKTHPGVPVLTPPAAPETAAGVKVVLAQQKQISDAAIRSGPGSTPPQMVAAAGATMQVPGQPPAGSGVAPAPAKTPCPRLFPADHFASKPDGKIYLPLKGGRAQGIQARLDKKNVGGGTPAATIMIAGWVENAPRDTIARGHLLANRLGGDGRLSVNLVPICQQTTNIDMRSCESQVRAHVDLGEVVDYEVTPEYLDRTHPDVPTRIVMRAMSMRADGTCWMLDVIINNPADLTKCPPKRQGHTGGC